MRVSTLAAAAAAAAAAAEGSASCSGPLIAGSVPVAGDGGRVTSWNVISSAAGTGVTVDATGAIVLNHNARAYITSACTTGPNFTPQSYTNPMVLLGKQLNFSVDMSKVPCACNAAFYAVLMPGIGANGQPAPSQGNDFYCDANDVGGTWCPEMDIMEANTAALQVTPHKCVSPDSNGYYASCDKGGCSLNTRSLGASAYGPGSSFSLDTTSPYSVSTSFVANSAGNLTSIVSVLSQPGRTPISLVHTDSSCQGPAYLEAMSDALRKGMIPTLSLWGDTAQTMSWLDMPPCTSSQNCDPSSVVTFRDISITTL